MKKILLIIIAITIVSCGNNEVIDTKNDFLNLFTNKKAKNHITFSMSNIKGKTASISLDKQFENEIDKQKYLDHRNYLKSKFIERPNEHYSPRSENFYEAYDMFGKSNSVSFFNKGEKKGNVNKKVYFPQEIAIKNPENVRELNTKKDLKLNWNPDLKNPNAKAFILLINRGNITENKIVNLENVYIKKIVDDNGSYTLSKRELEKFKSNNNIDIIISRGNQKIIDNTAYTILTTDLITSKVK